MTTETPRNEVRYFPIKISASVVESLERLKGTDLYGSTLTTVAEIMLTQWARSNQNSFERNHDLYQVFAEREGYVPTNVQSLRSIRPYPNAEASGNLKICVSGIIRYYIEKIGACEGHITDSNGRKQIQPFYQKNIEDIIIMAIRETLPIEIRKAINSGLIEE